MIFRKHVLALLMAAVAGIVFASPLSARAQEPPFPTYGSGAIEIRIYTDYFCPPCRAMEPSVEPILKHLLKKKTIRLTFVDVPFNPASPLCARYFLSALAVKNDALHAIKVRNILFEAAAKKDVGTKEQIEALFKRKGIAYRLVDTKAAFSSFNALIHEDSIQSTPNCVIIKEGKKQKFVGKIDILNALKQLH